jgi:hypothetical protein
MMMPNGVIASVQAGVLQRAISREDEGDSLRFRLTSENDSFHV